MPHCEICQKKRCRCQQIIDEENGLTPMISKHKSKSEKETPRLSLFDNSEEIEKFFIKKLLNSAKTRAEKKGIPFSLQESDIKIPKFCPVLNIPIYTSKLNSDNSPSLDRFDNKLGYVPSNVNVISTRANRIKNDSNLDEIEKLYFFLKEETSRRRG